MSVAQKLASLAYQAVSSAVWPAVCLYYLCRAGADGKYSSNWRARMGLDLPGLLGEGRARAWVHALSVGETLSAIPLVREIKKRRPDLDIVFSTATETGMSIARERLSDEVDLFFFMPHDFAWAVSALVRRVRPSLFVLIETDLWPNLLHALKREGVFTVLVNGRMSPGSHRRYSRFSGLTGMFFDAFDLIFTQTEQDRARFESLGAPAGKVSAAGNLKFESSVTPVSEAGAVSIRRRIGLDAGRPVWVAGSTHEGEEEIMLRVHRELVSQFPDLLLIIAPRKIDRRHDIESLCAASGFGCAVRSRGESASGKQVYLLDTLGELGKTYAVCDVAFLGGSFVPLGGHNPLEVVAHGKPACWGPHFYNFSEIEAALIETGCCGKMSSERELADFIKNGIGSGGACKPGAAAGIAGFQGGAASRIASALLEKV
ncbi:MAG: 3-deoxy-D-manno-octulosonic acid transferase [Syntrophobacteraceae bacterium]